jgi:hypothetical protein
LSPLAHGVVTLKHPGQHQGCDGSREYDLDHGETRLIRATISGFACWLVNLHGPSNTINLVAQDDLVTIIAHLYQNARHVSTPKSN